MSIEHVPGKNMGKLMLYALSTCGWCRRTKDLLNELGVEYDYVYVDKLEGTERETAVQTITKWNPSGSFPTLVINDEKSIVGFRGEQIRGVVETVIKETDVTGEEVDRLYEKLHKEAEDSGYHLSPDIVFTKELLNGMLINGKRYGYQACPCRLASGKKEEDLDILCPCDYRDPDLSEFGTCYCALYVTQDVLNGKQQVTSISERRPPPEERKQSKALSASGGISSLPTPVWRCSVCGYLCARDDPPEVCPICKAKKDRFHLFIS